MDNISIDKLMEMLTFCVQITLFEQEEGLDMGSPLLLVIADIYVESSEEMILGTAPFNPPGWLRYAVDTFILWTRQEAVQILQDKVNSVRPSISSTIEEESNNQRDFLGALITLAVWVHDTCVS